MKIKLSLLALILTLFATQIFAQNISGFGQVKIDTSGFFIPKVRIFLKSSDNGISGILGIKARYEVYADFDRSGKPELGYASLIFYGNNKMLPEIVVGRTLDPITYQFPAPFQLPTINYPKSCFNKPNSIGVFARENYGKFWAMVGVTDGTGGFKDDNKSFDFTSRVTYSLPFNFVVGSIYRNGKQPLGEKKFFGVDLTWKQEKIWVNIGQNKFEYTENKTGQWIWGTYELTNWFQLVGLVENIDNLRGWSVGFNLSPTKNTVVRVSCFKQAEIETAKSWGLLFQQCF